MSFINAVVKLVIGLAFYLSGLCWLYVVGSLGWNSLWVLLDGVAFYYIGDCAFAKKNKEVK